MYNPTDAEGSQEATEANSHPGVEPDGQTMCSGQASLVNDLGAVLAAHGQTDAIVDVRNIEQCGAIVGLAVSAHTYSGMNKDSEMCPPWCHGDHITPGEHAGDIRAVQPDVPIYPGNDRPGELLLQVRQDPGATAPQVVLSYEERPEEYPLTPAEARKLTGHLAYLAARAEAEPRPARTVKGTRPWWLPGECPSWCDWPDDHPDRACYSDRLHTGETRTVVLTANDAWPEDDDPEIAEMYIRQHYRETGPRIELGHNEATVGMQFTPDEAEEFAVKLLELAAIARAGGTAS